MKVFNYLLFLFVLVILYLGLQPTSIEKTYFSEMEKQEEKPEKLLPNDWMYMQRAFPTGKIDKAVYRKAKNIGQRLRQTPNPERNDRFEKAWSPAGSTNIGGRVSTLAMPNSNPNKIYAGVASGGIFLSEDAGQNWIPIFDDALSLSIGDIAIAPSNEDILYVGTGEANAGGGSLAYDGEGIYRSEDGGENWDAIGLQEIGSVGRLVVHPTNPNTVYVAAMGDLFGDSPNQGVYKTTNAGQSWEKVLYLNDSTGVIDLAIHPSNPDIVYAASWERVRRPNRRSYGGDGSGIHRSTDGGQTWEELEGGLPTEGSQKGRIAIAISPSNPNTLYAAIADAVGFLIGVYRTDDGGETWTNMGFEGIFNTSYMWWFGRIVVDPLDTETVYYMGLLPHKSTNGGANWEYIFFDVHVDQHAIVPHPLNTNQLVLGNDGGVFLSEDQGDTYEKIDNIPITQFYTCEIDDTSPDEIYGGAQDNSTMRTLTGNLDDWEIINGGDGFTCIVDPTDNNIIYAISQYGNLRRSTNGGQFFSSITNGIDDDARKNWNTPYVLDPNDPLTLYYGANRLYKSENRGQQWTAVSGDLSNGSIGGNIPFGTITSIGLSTVNTNIIWAGTDDGNVWVSTSGGTGMQLISEDLPMAWVTRITPHPEDENTAYLTLSGFRYNENEGHIYKTTDLGQNWELINGDLPDVPVNDILVSPDKNLLFIATDIGVFYSEDDGTNWDLLGTDMPLVVVTELEYNEETQRLLAATYGRSMFWYDLAESVSTNEVPTLLASLKAYPNPFTDIFTLEINNPKDQKVGVLVYNMEGRLIFSTPAVNLREGNYDWPMDGSQWPSGKYQVVIHDGNKNITTVNVLKK